MIPNLNKGMVDRKISRFGPPPGGPQRLLEKGPWPWEVLTGNSVTIILKPTQVYKKRLSEEPLIRNSAKLMCDCLPQT